MALSILSANVSSSSASEPQAQTFRDFLKTVSEGIDLINKFGDNLSDNARAIAVEIVNLTSYTFDRSSHRFDHGGFKAAFPPEIIGPYSTVAFGVGSGGGIATGVNGSIDYNIRGGGWVRFGFDNPFIGTNGHFVSARDGADGKVAIPSLISNGNQAHARFTIFDKLGRGARRQNDWRSCSKCKVLFYNGHGDKGVCPAGNGHDASGSYNYFSVYDGNDDSSFQNGWRSCSKCKAFCFAGIPGVCAAGGNHDFGDSWEYGVMHGTPAVEDRQVDWGSCVKCRGLFYKPHHGKCPAGGAHDARASFKYVLDYTL